ncbi:hypothetical protein BH708_06050 [Brachybacterium sp. P6-10-X1]|uniref:NAD(P)/FAD-dependent oxidoreductase n=1 Tax=Brachybacterium sp. P6-10-X1 TaxID=1903186 RepID=UPI00097187B1|nr:FAD-dependent oxidoreductase [Brachybacterium sp. P6-10-X1]APX32355.1 hypothetical protein BH708_06050 [Brachybacterium sp. P6-10-X1]
MSTDTGTDETFTYVLVGSGMTADGAARGIREIDPEGSILILGADADRPYTRPALTKKLWTDPDFTVDDNWMNTADDTGAILRPGTVADRIDPGARTVVAGGRRISYEKLLLATGGTPHRLDLPRTDRVLHFRTLADYRRLRELADRDLRVAVIGGSFIGTELAAALVQHDTRVTLIYPDQVLQSTPFPPGLARRFEQTYAEQGVTLRPESTVASGREIDGGRIELTLEGGSTIDVDAVVVGIGIAPLTSLAEDAGLDVDDGIVVDEQLRTSAEGVWAAGDVASYPDARLGRRRVEHVDHATTMGETVGRIMAGAEETYTHTPLFYSDVFEFSYEAVGEVDTSLEVIEDWIEPNARGVVFYLRDGRVRGVLLWGVQDKADDARGILAEEGPHTAADLRGRLTAD